MPATATLSHPAEGVALITIANPPRNFGTAELASRLIDALASAEKAGAAVAVLASDQPGYFIAHWSLAEIVAAYGSPSTAAPRARRPNLFDTLESSPMITIAANNGQAWGGGAELSWACDLRIAAESATYGQPEVALGIIPGAGGTTRLERLIGTTRCMQMIVDCEPIDAARALAFGAINKVVPDDRLRDEAIAWASRIARWPRAALAAAKRSLLDGRDLPMTAARRQETQWFAETARRPDALARMSAVQARYDAGDDSFAAIGLNR